jgi:hypothetical protein
MADVAMTRKARRGGRSRWTVGLLLAALAVAGGCGLDLSQKAEARNQWKRTYTLTPGGSIEIRNTNGRVQVTPGDGNAVEVVADRIARAASDEDARNALGRIEIAEDVAPGRIVLDSTKGGFGFEMHVSRRVDYVVRVPKGAGVTVHSTNGDIEVTGLSGAFEARTTNGSVTARALENGARVGTTNGEVTLDFAKLGEAGVTCETTNGEINLTLPRDAGARLSARVSNGDINTTGLALAVSEQSRRRLEASIGDGGPSIRLETTNGGIKVTGK